jgi:hypothetical protein
MFERRSTMPDAIVKTANSAAKSAKDVSDQLEKWAINGYGSARNVVTSGPFLWSAASLSLGAGLFALWRGNMKPGRRGKRSFSMQKQANQAWQAIGSFADGIYSQFGRMTESKPKAARTMAAKSRTKQSLRSNGAANGMGSMPAMKGKKAKRTRRPRRPANMTGMTTG